MRVRYCSDTRRMILLKACNSLDRYFSAALRLSDSASPDLASQHRYFPHRSKGDWCRTQQDAHLPAQLETQQAGPVPPHARGADQSRSTSPSWNTSFTSPLSPAQCPFKHSASTACVCVCVWSGYDWQRVSGITKLNIDTVLGIHIIIIIISPAH